MNITYKTRALYPDELKLLKKLEAQRERDTHSRIKFYHFIIAGALGAGCTYVASSVPDSFWTFLFGTTAVFSFGFIVFVPYEIYKQRNRQKSALLELNAVIEAGTVNACLINAKRIAIAPEYEDESDLYIVELSDTEVLHIWDTEYNLGKKFPCLNFEIYDDRNFGLTGIQINSLSEKIEPTRIDKNVKWEFMTRYGSPGHLEVEKINYDQLLQKYHNCVIA